MLSDDIMEIIQQYLHFDINENFELEMRECRAFIIYADRPPSPCII